MKKNHFQSIEMCENCDSADSVVLTGVLKKKHKVVSAHFSRPRLVIL